MGSLSIWHNMRLLTHTRVIGEDVSHSHTEKRYYCFGKVGDRVITVR